MKINKFNESNNMIIQSRVQKLVDFLDINNI